MYEKEEERERRKKRRAREGRTYETETDGVREGERER